MTRVGRVLLILALLTGLTGLTGCGHAASPPAELGIDTPTSGDPFPAGELEGDDSGLAAVPHSASPSPSPTKKPSPRPSTVKTVKPGGDTGGKVVSTADGVPLLGSGTFTVAGGGTDVVGSADATTLVKYQVEMENGIQWGSFPAWSTSSLAAEVDRAVAAPQGWTASGAHPVTYDSGQTHISGATWKFQRVSDGGYNVVLRHMKCPGAGQPAPVMQTQTIALNGCTPNAYPFTSDGTFVQGPWASS